MPEFDVGDAGGIRRTVANVQVHDGTAQRTIKQGWVGDPGGVARLFFASVTLNNADIVSSPPSGTASARFELHPDGFAWISAGASVVATQRYQWTQGSTAAYEAFVTVTSGALSGGAVGSWVSLASLQSWSRTAGHLQEFTCSFTIQIRSAGGGTVLASATINMDAIGPGT